MTAQTASQRNNVNTPIKSYQKDKNASVQSINGGHPDGEKRTLSQTCGPDGQIPIPIPIPSPSVDATNTKARIANPKTTHVRSAKPRNTADIPVLTVLFVEQTQGGELARRLQQVEERMAAITGYRVRIPTLGLGLTVAEDSATPALRVVR